MVTLKDIAAHLSISVSTVSRVVNNQDRVDPVTRKKVLEALRQFNYQPNENARRLKTNVSNVLGVIVSDISNPFFASVLKGIETVAAQEGYSVILCNTGDSRRREVEAVKLLMRQKVAGMIVATIMDSENVKEHYLSIEQSLVFFDNIPYVDTPVHSVTIDNKRAAKELVAHMIEQGHHRVFMISGPQGESSADERVMGWKLALAEAGIEPEEDWLAYGDFKEESGKQIVQDFLSRKQAPTAICVANNFMAYGAIQAIEKAGLAIPQDVSIGAFDVVDTTGLMRLNITTIIEPTEQIGMVAANMCINSNTPDGIKLSQHMILEHDFHINNTVGKA